MKTFIEFDWPSFNVVVRCIYQFRQNDPLRHRNSFDNGPRSNNRPGSIDKGRDGRVKDGIVFLFGITA